MTGNGLAFTSSATRAACSAGGLAASAGAGDPAGGLEPPAGTGDLAATFDAPAGEGDLAGGETALGEVAAGGERRGESPIAAVCKQRPSGYS